MHSSPTITPDDTPQPPRRVTVHKPESARPRRVEINTAPGHASPGKPAAAA